MKFPEPTELSVGFFVWSFYVAYILLIAKFALIFENQNHKIMKKALFIVVAFFIMVSMSAQVTFGPKVGFTLSKYGYKYSSSLEYKEPESKFKLGPAIGFMMNVPILEFLSFQPSLMYSKKGTGVDVAFRESGDAVITGYERVRVSYLELPLNLALGLKIGTFKFQIFAGPYFAYAIAGKHKWDYEENVNGNRKDIKGDEKITFKNEVPTEDFENTKPYQRPFDLGINFGVGYKVKSVLLNLGYAMGFSNLQPEVQGDDSYATDHKYYNRTIFVSAAWLFE